MLGERLARIRETRGYTQLELSKALGLGDNQIWRYENGKTEPDGKVIALIARHLNVSADYLLGLIEYPEPYIEGNLTTKEIEAITAWRHGDIRRAVLAIVGDE